MAQTSQSVALPKRLPLIAQPSNRSNNYYKDARLVNCYAERNEAGEWEIEQRVGLGPTPAYQLSGVGFGMFCWGISLTDRQLYMVSGNTLYQVALRQGVPNLVTLAQINIGNGSQIRFLPIPSQSATPGNLMIASTAAAYNISASGVVVQINDPNYPLQTVPGIAYLDGTTYVMDVYGQIWGTAGLDNTVTWDGLNVIPANSEPDLPVALAKQLVYVVALKQWTTLFFFDNQNPTGSPLSPVPGALINYGCLSSETLQELDGVLFWVTSSRTESPQVCMLQNLQIRIISTPAVDRLLETSRSSSQFYSLAFKWAGHKFYVVTVVSANITLVFDVDQNLWYEWTDYLGNYYPICSVSIDLVGRRLFQSIIGGQVWYMDADYVYPNDAGKLFPVDIYTPNFDAGTKRIKTLNMMYFDADQTSGAVLQARYSDDDYQSWSNFRSIDLNDPKPLLDSEGSFVRRAYHFRKQSSTPFRIRAVDIQLDLGTL